MLNYGRHEGKLQKVYTDHIYSIEELYLYVINLCSSEEVTKTKIIFEYCDDIDWDYIDGLRNYYNINNLSYFYYINEKYLTLYFKNLIQLDSYEPIMKIDRDGYDNLNIYVDLTSGYNDLDSMLDRHFDETGGI